LYSSTDGNNNGVIEPTEILEEHHYYPFGLEHQNYSTITGNTGYKYTFGGKEFQPEKDMNMYDFGARNYDPALGRWMNVDPLAEKFVGWSPYNYTYNDPINVIDPDGRNGIRIVDKENKTIIVKANYYVQTEARRSDYGGSLNGYSLSGIENLNKEVNAALNAAGMTISEGEFEGYSVSFDLQFFDGGTVDNAKKLAQNDMFVYDGQSYNIGNSYSRWDQTEPKFRENNNGDKSKVVGGYVESNQFLTINKNKEGSIRTNKTILHEIMHTFGRKDYPINVKGIMNYPPQYFNQDDVNFFGGAGIYKNDLQSYRQKKIFPFVKK